MKHISSFFHKLMKMDVSHLALTSFKYNLLYLRRCQDGLVSLFPFLQTQVVVVTDIIGDCVDSIAK